MHETADDLRELQRLLHDSRARAGSHMASIFTDVTRMDADEVCTELAGMRVLDVATVTAAGAPRIAPVDGLFWRGRFHFGSAPDSVRARHLRARPAVSAAHTRAEELTVIVHGTAVGVDVRAPEHEGFHACLLEVYGQGWDEWAAPDAPYWRIEPERMYAARVSRLGGS